MFKVVILEYFPNVADSNKPSATKRLLRVLHGLNTNKLYALNHSVFLCFVWISKQRAVISLNSISWFVSITHTEILIRRAKRIFLEVNLIPMLKVSYLLSVGLLPTSDPGGTVLNLGQNTL